MPPSLLPFLYPARRVACGRMSAVVVRDTARRLHGSARRHSDEAETAPGPLRDGAEDTGRAGRPYGRRYDPIPFDLPPEVAAELERERAAAASGADEGTITPHERRAFRRIFREIKTRKKHEDGSAEADIPTLRSRVNAIVDGAAGDVVRARGGRRAAAAAAEEAGDEADAPGEDDQQRAGPRGRREAVLEQFPASLRAAAGEAMGIREKEELRDRESGREAADDELSGRGIDGGEQQEPHAPTPEEEARQRRQTRMELLMLSKKSDFALWDYMERDVFALASEFGLVRGGRQPTAATGRALATYAPLYPALLLHGLRLLDSRAGGGAGGSALALAVLPRVKSLGLASYVLGAGTALYNADMAIRWGRHGDWAAVLRLLAEMQRAGLVYDAGTLAVVRSMEWHLAGGLGSLSRGPGLAEDSFVGSALRMLPETAGLVDKLQYWRRQVERGVRLAGDGGGR